MLTSTSVALMVRASSLCQLSHSNAKITQIYEGTNQIQRMVMARQLLK